MNGFDGKGGNDIKILKVLAEDYENDFGTVKSFGIHNLMEQTYDSAKIGIERACTHSIMEQGKEILKAEFGEIIKKIKENIFGNLNEIKENEQPNYKLDNILNEEKKRKNYLSINDIDNFDYINFMKFSQIFAREIIKNLLFREKISEETINSIDTIIESELEKVHQLLEQIFLAQLESISNILTEDLVDFVSRLETKYQIKSLSSKYNHNELKWQAKNAIVKNFKPVLDDIIYRDISQIIFQKFYEKISIELMTCFQELSKGNKRFREIFGSKGKEISVVCLNKIKNMMDYPNDDYEERNPKPKVENKKKSKYEELEEDDEEEREKEKK